MYCNHCGNNLPENSQFCNHCGERVLGRSTQRFQRNMPPPPTARHPRRRVRIEDRFEDHYVEDEFDDEFEYEEEEYEIEEEDGDEEYGEDEHEREIFRINPAIYGVVIRYFVAITLSVIATAIIGYFSSTLLSQVSFLTALGISTVLMINPIYHHLQHHRIEYILTTVKLEIESGFFSKTSRNIPLRHIQDVTVKQTFKERMLGVGDVIIDSAVMEGTMPLQGIKNPRKYAALILHELQYWN